ncbi:MAG: hypothetical protein ACP5M9_01845 [Candidatus Micrarchaeia archaeon]
MNIDKMSRPLNILPLGIFIFSLMFIFSLGASTSSTQLVSLLKSYNVSNSLISSFSFVNVTYGNNNYTIVYQGSNPYFLINTSITGNYNFVLNATSISQIIKNETVQLLIKQINYNQLEQGVTAYMETSAAPLSDCIVETGINRATCTVSNYCQSCALVPACNKVLYATNGPTGVLGEGIMSFEQSYYALQNNLSIFYRYTNESNLSTYNYSKIDLDAQMVTAAYNNISQITQNLYQNPIFPPTQNSDLALCNQAGGANFNISSSSGPWYCNAIGYCEFLSYNYTMLSNLNAVLNSINAKVPTQEKINQVAMNVSSYEDLYIVPKLKSQKSSVYESVINTTLSNYNKTVENAQMLLSHISNSNLSEKLTLLENNYKTLEQDYLTLNITNYSKKLSSELNTVNNMYTLLNKTYSSILSKAQNNTALLIGAQLSSPYSVQLANYSFEENKINTQLDSQLSNTSSINKSLNQISGNISYVNGPDLSLQSLSRAIDGPFVTLMSGALNLNYAQTVSSAPLLSALFSLIIGLIILLLIFLLYIKLKSSKKIRISNQTIKNWHLLFILIIVLVLVYVLLTYFIASSANGTSSLSSFKSALSSSHSLIIVINNTDSTSASLCATEINNTAKSEGYISKIYKFSGNSCTPGLSNVSDCMNSFARTGIPVVLLTTSNTSSINLYSMYGTLLSINGGDQVMNSCYGSFFIK